MNETRRSAITPSLKTLHRSLFPAIAVARFESRLYINKNRRKPFGSTPVSAMNETRTRTLLQAGDFKSPVSTIPPSWRYPNTTELITARQPHRSESAWRWSCRAGSSSRMPGFPCRSWRTPPRSPSGRSARLLRIPGC